MNNTQLSQQDAILNEIFIKPSNQIRANGLASLEETTSAAPCNGQCEPGQCFSSV